MDLLCLVFLVDARGGKKQTEYLQRERIYLDYPLMSLVICFPALIEYFANG